MRLKLSFFTLFLMALALSFAQGVRLERRPKVDETNRLRVAIEIDIGGTKAIYGMLLTERIASVDANGDYTVESRASQATLKYGELTNAIPDAPARSTVFRANGEFVASKGEPPTASEVRMARLSAFISPGKDVKIGDRWSHPFAATPSNGGIGGRADYRIESSTKVGERAAFVVAFNFKEDIGSTPASSQGKMWIDSENGQLLRLECDWSNAPMSGAPAPMNAKVTITRSD